MGFQGSFVKFAFVWVLGLGLVLLILAAPSRVAAGDHDGQTGTQPHKIDAGVESLRSGGRADEVAPFFEFWKGQKWKSRKLKYFYRGKEYKQEVKDAAAAWNASGVKAKWIAVARKRADILIKADPNLPGIYSGSTKTNGRRATIRLSPGMTGENPKNSGTLTAQTVAAHEMGHVLGLWHEDNVCAAMNSSPFRKCRGPKEDWQYRCRFLHEDDVRGAIRLFGGKPEPLGPSFCDLEPAPAGVINLTAAYVESKDDVLIEWDLPDQNPPRDVTIYAGPDPGVCPTEDTGYTQSIEYLNGDAAVHYLPYHDVNCYLATSESSYGRRGPDAYVQVTVP